jgi:hypothetical protein
VAIKQDVRFFPDESESEDRRLAIGLDNAAEPVKSGHSGEAVRGEVVRGAGVGALS